jgi:hypothetical protein
MKRLIAATIAGLLMSGASVWASPPDADRQMEPFPASLERDLVALPRGYRRGVLDGHAVIYQPKTQVIIDVTVLF